MKKNIVLNGLAGAAALAGASQTYGAVVAVPLPANITGHAPAASDTGTRVNIDLDKDGRSDLSILYRNLSETGGAFTLSYVVAGTTAVPGATVGTAISGQAYAYNLAVGTLVGPTSGFYQKTGYFTHLVTNYAGTNYGFTPAGVVDYIGFKFTAGTGATAITDYGYIEVETDLYASAASPGGIKFLKLAYDNAGLPIAVGANPLAVPEPGSLAALALGAVAVAGVAVKRRQRAAAQA